MLPNVWRTSNYFKSINTYQERTATSHIDSTAAILDYCSNAIVDKVYTAFS